MEDWRGNTIELGSTVLYVTRQSSTIRLIEAYVLDIGEDFIVVKPLIQKSYGKAALRRDKQVKLTRIDLITVLE